MPLRPILVLVPSVGRAKSLGECLLSLSSAGTGLADILSLGGGNTAIEALNAVPREVLALYEIIGIVCDDVRVRTPAWDRLVFDRLHGKTGMVWGSDGIQNEKIPTHPFFSSAIPLTLGYVMPPELHCFYGDNFFMDLLKPLGLAEYMPQLVTEHLHYSVGKSLMDDTYRRSDRHWPADTTAYAVYKATRLKLDQEKIATALRRA